MPDDLNASSSAPSCFRKRKSTTGNNVAAKKRLRVSISVSADNEVETNRITDSVAVGEEGVVKKRRRRSKPVCNEGADNEVGANKITDSVAAGEEGAVKKRTRRSKPVGNEGAVRKRRGSVNRDDEAGTIIMMDPAIGEEGVVKKRTRRSKPIGTEGPASIGGDGVVKKRTGSVSTENHCAVTKRNSASSR